MKERSKEGNKEGWLVGRQKQRKKKKSGQEGVHERSMVEMKELCTLMTFRPLASTLLWP